MFSACNQFHFLVLHTARVQLKFIHVIFVSVSCYHAVERSRRFMFKLYFLVQASCSSGSYFGLTTQSLQFLICLFTFSYVNVQLPLETPITIVTCGYS